MTWQTLFKLRAPMKKIARIYGWCFVVTFGDNITVIAPTCGYWDVVYLNDNQRG